MGVDPADVEESFVRGSGPGGQKINKTASTIWLRHRASGIAVRCQAERSQSVNRMRAWEILCGKLEERAKAARAQVQDEREAERRRNRQKSRSQKARMVAEKRHRRRLKDARRRDSGEE